MTFKKVSGKGKGTTDTAEANYDGRYESVKGKDEVVLASGFEVLIEGQRLIMFFADVEKKDGLVIDLIEC